MNANDYLRDAAIAHAIEIERLGRGTANKALELFNASITDQVGKLAARLATNDLTGSDRGPATTKRIADIITEQKALADAVYGPIAAGVKADLGELAKYEASFTVNKLKGALGATVGLNAPPGSYLAQLVENSPITGRLLASWTEGLPAAHVARIEEAVRIGLLNGEGVDSIVNRLRGTKAANFRDGLMEKSRFNLQSFALTANSTVAANTREEVYQRNPRWIKAVKWISTLDTKTTPYCQQHDGMVWPLGEPHPTPPAHIRCRSIIIPITKSFDDLGVKDRAEVSGKNRASMDGQVPGDTTFEDWIGRQSAERQDAVFGKERAQLYRDGKVSFKDLFNDAGEYRSLKELRAGDARSKPAPIAPEPPKAQAPTAPEAPKFIQPRNAEVNAETIEVQKKAAITKQLNETLGDAAGDFAYSQKREFKGRSEKDWGKAQLSGFTDEAASTVAAIMPELNELADAFGVPRLRGVKALSPGSSANMDMGDGVMAINPSFVNPLTADLGEGGSAVLVKKADEIREDMEKLRGRIGEYGTKINDHIATGAGYTDDYVNLIEERNFLAKQYNKMAEKLKVAKRQAQGTVLKTSEWKLGDAIADKPWSVKEYYDNGVDRIRSTMYHEFAHHVHQMTGKVGSRLFSRYLPPLEKDRIPTLYRSLGKEGRADLASKYGEGDPFEFFAEQFALYMMGQQVRMAKGAINLIEELMTNARK